MENKQTAVTALFAELKLLAEGMRFSQDNQYANLIDYICTKQDIVLQWEKEQIKDAFVECWVKNVPEGIECKFDSEQYYNETYGNAND